MKVRHLPGHIVEPPDPSPDIKVLKGSYTASTGLEIPVEIHMHKDGIIWRLWQEEQARRKGLADRGRQIEDGPVKIYDVQTEVVTVNPPDMQGIEQRVFEDATRAKQLPP